MVGFKLLSESISSDLLRRLPEQRATQRRKLSELVAGMLVCQTPNLMELSNVLDRPTDSVEARYNYVERFLKNPLVKHDYVMESYASELLQRLSAHQHTLVFMMDQSKVNADLELLMVSVRVRKRAVPLFWCAQQTKGGIGFTEQKKLLDVVNQWLPEGTRVMLAGDRFYGTAELIRWCQEHQWQYRLRLKGNLCVYQDQGEDKNLNTLHAEGTKQLEKARFRMGVTSSVGILHEKGHKEPWFIAMDCKPSEYKTRDYGMMWGIENMFADFKSRGFSLMDSKIQIADRMERLILVLAIALHWAVSIGSMKEKQKKTLKGKRDHASLFLRQVSALSENALATSKNHRLYAMI